MHSSSHPGLNQIKDLICIKCKVIINCKHCVVCDVSEYWIWICCWQPGQFLFYYDGHTCVLCMLMQTWFLGATLACFGFVWDVIEMWCMCCEVGCDMCWHTVWQDVFWVSPRSEARASVYHVLVMLSTYQSSIGLQWLTACSFVLVQFAYLFCILVG